MRPWRQGDPSREEIPRRIREQAREIERLKREKAEIERERDQLRDERDRLERERDRLRDELETARRAAKRQAAPFSKGAPTPTPRRPGRKPGRAYGPRAWRPVPAHIDAVVEVLPPAACPTCGGAVGTERVAVQYQADLPPVRPHVTAFHRSTSTSAGAGGVGGAFTVGTGGRPRPPRVRPASHVGPRALAWAAWLHTALGVPFAKVATILRTGCGLTIYGGVVVRDGWAPYRKLPHATHQTGLALTEQGPDHVRDERGEGSYRCLADGARPGAWAAVRAGGQGRADSPASAHGRVGVRPLGLPRQTGWRAALQPARHAPVVHLGPARQRRGPRPGPGDGGAREPGDDGPVRPARRAGEAAGRGVADRSLRSPLTLPSRTSRARS